MIRACSGAAAWCLLSLTVLAGCQSSNTQSAWSLIKAQQEQQALMQQAEEDAHAKRQPTEPQIALSIIREAQRQGKDFAALAYIDAYEQQFGAGAELAILQADSLRRTGQIEKSEAVYRRLITSAQAAQAWHGLGLLAGARGDYVQAVQNLERATRLAPTNAQMLGDLGYAYLLGADTAGARVPLGKAAELEPTNGKVLANMALLLVLDGNTGQAQQLMERAQLDSAARAAVFEQAAQIHQQTRAQAALIATSPAGASNVASVKVTRSDAGHISGPMLQPVMERMVPSSSMQ
ncbi:tetratricopeptide repeat protein [Bordetella sp. 15P40C-2]|uniref:tetratricopeptide repeat protein n=1 Tax=Bordetella sp. 15P40C-2 TaxID=2572246 RepID=UPI0013277D02|nr:tetratricopeptide repeat protein [Bordetella sp. 15P40C-2]MVW70572.1 hypothetical protein [Bordetella sp. 15P40C-2]